MHRKSIRNLSSWDFWGT